MEINAKNCLGPSEYSILIAYGEQCHWFDEQTYIGPDGVADIPDTEEARMVERRIEQLEDLMSLKRPPSMDYCQGQTCGWTNAEIKLYEDYLAQEAFVGDDDPMGDMMGRNE